MAPGIYEVQGEAADLLPVRVILSRTGAFLVCNIGQRQAGWPVLGHWRTTRSGELELRVTHFVWSAGVPMGVPPTGCGGPSDPIIPYERGEQYTARAAIEGRDFRWPLAWTRDSPRPLCVPVASAGNEDGVSLLDFDIPAEAAYGGGSDGTLQGTYELDRTRFGETLRAAGFGDPEALAAATDIVLEIRPDGTFTLHQNHGWVTGKPRKPFSARGRWIVRGGELYLRFLSESDAALDDVSLMWMHPNSDALDYRAPNGDAAPGEDATDLGHAMSFRLARRGD